MRFLGYRYDSCDDAELSWYGEASDGPEAGIWASMEGRQGVPGVQKWLSELLSGAEGRPMGRTLSGGASGWRKPRGQSYASWSGISAKGSYSTVRSCTGSSKGGPRGGSHRSRCWRIFLITSGS